MVSSYVKAGIIPSVEQACERWIESLEHAEAFIEAGNSSRVKTVKYEEFVKEPEWITRELCVFLDIEFEDQMFANREEVKLGDDHFEYKKM